MTKSDELLAELVHAIGAKWDGETDKRRSNALSPKIEAALRAAKRHLKESGVPVKKSAREVLMEEVLAERDKLLSELNSR